jgi:DNA-binding response OmpR family regulator
MSGTILIVEDECLIALHLKSKLEQAGFAVAGMADNAFALAAKHLPDIVLMDIHLKGERDGIFSAAQIRQKLDIPVIFLTADTDRDTVERAKLSEPAGYISKPFLNFNFAVRIEIALSRFQTERKIRLSERRYRSVVERATELILPCGRKGYGHILQPGLPGDVRGRSEQPGPAVIQKPAASRGPGAHDAVLQEATRQKTERQLSRVSLRPSRRFSGVAGTKSATAV